MTLAEFVSAYAGTLDPTTQGQHEVVLSLVRQALGDPSPTELFQREAVERFKAWLQREPFASRFGRPRHRSAATVNQKLGVVLAWWEDAFAEGIINERPISRRQRRKLRLKQPKPSPRAWTEEQFRAILANVNAAPECPGWGRQHVKALLQTLYYSGARIAGLLPCSVADLDGELLFLPAAESKTDQQQPCRLPEWLADALRGLPRPPNDTRLFAFPFSVECLRGHLKRILTAAGLPAGRRDLFHRIRRTSGTLVARNGGLAAAQEHLGHASADTTRRYVDASQLDGDRLKFLPDVRYSQ